MNRLRLRLRNRPIGMLFVAGAVMLGIGPSDLDSAMAQTAEDTSAYGALLPAKYELRRRLSTAKELIKAKRFGEAVKLLDGLISGKEDYFLKHDAKMPYRHTDSLKHRAADLLNRLPAKGLEWYELQYGEAARRLLASTPDGNQIDGAREAARRYFHTTAGHDAALLLAQYHGDHRSWLAAANWCDRLLASQQARRFEPGLSVMAASFWHRAGYDDRAIELLRQLAKSNGPKVVSLAGRDTQLPAETDDLLKWLDKQVGSPREVNRPGASDWSVYGGDSRRSAVAQGSAPLQKWRWRLPVAQNPDTNERVSQLLRAYRQRDFAALPSLSPLVVGDLVLMRGASNLVAVDLRTGKQRWWSQPPRDDFRLGTSTGTADRRQSAYRFAENLDRRLWEDSVYGRLSSDGSCVFAVEEFPPLSDEPLRRVGIDANGRRSIRPAWPRNYNRLAAYQLESQGKLAWNIGGRSGGDEKRLAGAFFLGPPLPLDGRLYALAEIRGQVILAVLAADTGRLQWTQQLTLVNWDVLRNMPRRYGGASPSYVDGLLVCPTSSGAIVAVDLGTRQLKWAYRYSQNPRAQYTRVGRVRALQDGNSDGGGKRWTDSSVVISGGYVLATPVDNYNSRARTGQIHCIDLLTGERKWAKARGDNLFIACVHSGHVVLAGRGKVTAMRLADGLPPWVEKSVKLPDAALPSGRGFLSGKQYYLPLATGKIARINVVDGTIVDTLPLQAGFTPGNLICVRDQIISQGPDHLAAFDQLDASRQWAEAQLRTRPDHPGALVRRGQIRLEAGKVAAAITDLRRAVDDDKDNERARELLVSALFKGLKAADASGSKLLEELQRRVERPREKATLYRLTADGLRNKGKTLEALEAYLKLVDLGATPSRRNDLEEVTPVYAVRRSRWLRTALTALRLQATDEDRSKIDRLIASRLSTEKQAMSIADLQTFLEYFADFPAADTARIKLLAQLSGPSTLLERERLLRRLSVSKTAKQRGAAVAGLASLLVEANRADEASAYYRQLTQEFADVVCVDGKTGRQIVDGLRDTSTARRYLNAQSPWPHGRVKVTSSPLTTVRAPSITRAFRVALRGTPGSAFGDTTIHLNQEDHIISARDPDGAERWKISLTSDSFRGSYPFVASASFCKARGHLMLFASRNVIYAIDTLRASRGDSESILWRQRRNEEIPGINVGQGLASNSWNRYRYTNRTAKKVGPMGPVTPHGVCFQRLKDLVCVDLATGETLWVRRDLPKNCHLWGDDELLFVLPPRALRAIVINARDGKRLGEREVPRRTSWLATAGRNILMRTIDDGDVKFQLIDPWNSKEICTPMKFAARTRHTLVDSQHAAMLEPDGRLVLVDLTDGRTVVDHAIETPRDLKELLVLPSKDQWIVITNGAPGEVPPGLAYAASPSGFDCKQITGYVQAFDRKTGEPQWASPAAVSQFGLMLNQPRNLPAIIFSRRVTRKPRPGRPAALTWETLCLDKRTGRLLHEEKGIKQSLESYVAVADRSRRAMSLIRRSTATELAFATLTFTDEPVAPRPPYQGPAPPARPKKKLSRDPFDADSKSFDDPFSSGNSRKRPINESIEVEIGIDVDN